MTKKLNIPDDLQEVFQRSMNLLPDELRHDSHIRKVVLLYLKFGGEKLARQCIKIIKLHYREKAFKNTHRTETSKPPLTATIHITNQNSSDDSLEFPTE